MFLHYLLSTGSKPDLKINLIDLDQKAPKPHEFALGSICRIYQLPITCSSRKLFMCTTFFYRLLVLKVNFKSSINLFYILASLHYLLPTIDEKKGFWKNLLITPSNLRDFWETSPRSSKRSFFKMIATFRSDYEYEIEYQCDVRSSELLRSQSRLL